MALFRPAPRHKIFLIAESSRPTMCGRPLGSGAPQGGGRWKQSSFFWFSCWYCRWLPLARVHFASSRASPSRVKGGKALECARFLGRAAGIFESAAGLLVAAKDDSIFRLDLPIESSDCIFRLYLWRRSRSLDGIKHGKPGERDMIVHFSCPNCLAVYRATQAPRAEKGYNSFSCKNCGTPVHEWTGLYDFLDWRHVLKGDPEAESFW